MTEDEYRDARKRVLAGDDPPAALIEDARRTVALLIRTAGLPTHYSPLGVWSEEAIEEVFADWVAVRLIGRGQLLAMAQRSPALAVFRRMSETSIRQHLIDRLERSQSNNLFERVGQILEADQRFLAIGSGTGRLWRLADGPSRQFEGEDRKLLGIAWAQGQFNTLRYEPGARKLAPLLSSEDLDRFITGMLGSGAMSAGTLVRALQLRFALQDHVAPSELDSEISASPADDPQRETIVSDMVTATLGEVTARQAGVLVGLSEERSGREIAIGLGCSTGTVSHERSQLEKILARLGTDAPAVLKQVLDALLREDV